MIKPTYENKFTVRTVPELIEKLHLARLRERRRKFQGRKVGLESLAAAFVSHCLGLSEAEQAAILDRELPQIEAAFEAMAVRASKGLNGCDLTSNFEPDSGESLARRATKKGKSG